jgi:hypothetical protein
MNEYTLRWNGDDVNVVVRSYDDHHEIVSAQGSDGQDLIQWCDELTDILYHHISEDFPDDFSDVTGNCV